MVIHDDACVRWQVEPSHNGSELPLALDDAPIGEQGERAARIIVVDAAPEPPLRIASLWARHQL